MSSNLFSARLDAAIETERGGAPGPSDAVRTAVLARVQESIHMEVARNSPHERAPARPGVRWVGVVGWILRPSVLVAGLLVGAGAVSAALVVSHRMAVRTAALVDPTGEREAESRVKKKRRTPISSSVAAAPLAVSADLPPPAPPPIVPAAGPPRPRRLAMNTLATAPAVNMAAPAPTAPADSTLAAERQILDAARAALVRGAFGTAAAWLDQHRREFAAGTLIEEREALRVQMLAGSGRADDARAALAEFARRFPSSLFLPALTAAAPDK